MKHGGNVWQGEMPSEWLDYSANLRPEGTPNWVREALLRGMENARYYPDPSMKRAKEALSEYFGIPADCVLPTAGGISAIQLANKLPGSETVLLTPCFCEYEQFATSPIRKVSLLKSYHEIALPEILELKENGLVWLCNPMNPVGCAFTKTEIETLLHKIESQNSYLVVDEAFIEYCPEHSVVDLIAKHDRLLITGSMTKILGIPGVRLGYLCEQFGQILVVHGGDVFLDFRFSQPSLLTEALPQRFLHIGAGHGSDSLRYGSVHLLLIGDAHNLDICRSAAAFVKTGNILPQIRFLLRCCQVSSAFPEGEACKNIRIRVV